MTQTRNTFDDFFKDLNGTVEDIFNELRATLDTPQATKPAEAKSEPVEVDPLAEVYRVLRKAEEKAAGRENESEILLNVAASYTRIIETAVIYQS